MLSADLAKFMRSQLDQGHREPKDGHEPPLRSNKRHQPSSFSSSTTAKQGSLSQFLGKVIVLEFWNPHCGPCLSSFEWLSEFHKTHRIEGLSVVGCTYAADDYLSEQGKELTREQSLKKFRDFLAQKKVDYPMVLAKDAKVLHTYGVLAEPTFVVLDRQGKNHLLRSGHPRIPIRRMPEHHHESPRAMSQVWPQTRHTLIARLCDSRDQAAWSEFVTIYERAHPAICVTPRFATRRCGGHLPTRALERSPARPDAWNVGRRPRAALSSRIGCAKVQVTRNAVINLLQRETKHWGHGDSQAIDLLGQIPDGMDESLSTWNKEYQLQVLQLAAVRVRDRFQNDSWDLFWRTTVGNEPIESVATELNKSIGAAYAIRSRILLAIREAAKSMVEQENTGNEP